MTWDRAFVDLVGLGLIGGIVWFFWLVKPKGVRAAATSGGYQEQMVLVKGGLHAGRDRGGGGKARAAHVCAARIGLVHRDGAAAGLREVGDAAGG
jgi:hypothetical protein